MVKQRWFTLPMTILYDAKSPVSTTLRWHNTILKEVILSLEFWFFMLVSFALSLAEMMGGGGTWCRTSRRTM